MSELLFALKRVLRRLGLLRQAEAELLPALLRAVRADVPDASAEDLLDALWLALHTSAAQPAPRRSLWPWRRGTQQRPALALPANPQAATAPAATEPAPRPQQEDAAAGLYLDYPDGTQAGLPFRTPAAPAIPTKLALLRALRPLLRQVPSRVRLKLAERDTVEEIARTGTWEPCLVPETERWLRAALVVDRGESMALWTQTARELAQLLQRYGVFSDVRIFSLETEGAVQIFPGLGPQARRGMQRHRSVLLDPAGRSVVLVLSDCVSAAWHNGSMAACLERWGQQAPVALIQVLPAALWPRTALGRAAPVWLQAGASATPNSKLTVRFQHRWMRFPAPHRAVPVMTLEIPALRTWARMIAGAGGAWAPGVALGRLGQAGAVRPAGHGAAGPKERLQRFRLAATEPAWELARLLAAVPPFNLAVLRLVRQSLVPRARQVHEAEVLLGGLLEVQKKTQNPEDARYGYPPALREIFLRELRPTEIAGVLGTVSEYITKNLGGVQDFQALLAHPQKFQGKDVLDQSHFALVTASVLASLGGPYAALAGLQEVEPKRRLEEKSEFANRKRSKKVFVAHAEEDTDYFRQLRSHMVPLLHARRLEVLHEGDVRAGSVYTDEVSRMLDEAGIIIILLSFHLLASDRFFELELPKIRASYKSGEADVLLIRLVPTEHAEDLVSGLPLAPLDRPITQYPERDRAWSQVVRELDKLLMNPGITRRTTLVESHRRQHKPLKIFLGYANEDQQLARRFEAHLKVLQRQGIISEWFDPGATSGPDLPSKIEYRLNQADLILFLLSADFLASPFHMAVEVLPSLKHHKAGQAKVIPIIARPSHWRASPLGELAALPKNERPVTDWESEDVAWLEVISEISRLAMDSLHLKSATSDRPTQSFWDRVTTLFTPQAKPIESRSIWPARPIQVLIFAAREDDRYRDQLMKHLYNFQRRGLMRTVSFGDLVSGDESDEVLQRQIQSAEIVVILVSADLFATENTNLERILHRASSNRVMMVPVLVRWVEWQHSPLARFQCLPNNEVPVMASKNIDQTWSEVATRLSEIALQISRQR